MAKVEMSQSSHWLSRAELLLGSDAIARLAATRVIVFGVGGVGSWATETLVRSGIGHITIVDYDDVAPSNINRQAPALASTVGESKVEVMKRMLHAINPQVNVVAIDKMYTPETATEFCLEDYDYVIDAIDSLRDKALLINNATRSNCKLFSSMGAALKTDPTRVAVAEFWQAKGCRLAAALRRRFKKGDMPRKKFKVVYSDEIKENYPTQGPLNSGEATDDKQIGSHGMPNGSLMQVTATFGITLASLVVNDVARKVCDASL